jgi:hypothetical protein
MKPYYSHSLNIIMLIKGQDFLVTGLGEHSGSGDVPAHQLLSGSRLTPHYRGTIHEFPSSLEKSQLI